MKWKGRAVTTLPMGLVGTRLGDVFRKDICMREYADIVVIGGGTMGSMISWRLSVRGFSVTCIESHSVAHSRSAVAGDSRLFRKSYRGATELRAVLSTAQEQWMNLNSSAGEEVFVNCGGLYIGHSEGRYLTELAACCSRDEVDHEVLTAAEVHRRFPQHRVGDHESALFEPSAGFIRTERAVHAAFGLAKQGGAKVISGTPATSVLESESGVVVNHTDGSIQADAVVIAAGVGSPELLPDHLRSSLEARREILTWFPTLKPTAFEPSAFPIFVHIDGEFSAYGAPALDGSTLKSTLDDRARSIKELPNHRHTLTPDEIRESEATAARFFNDVHPQVSRQECLADLYTQDGQALVGLVPDTQRTYVSTGFSGAGFKMSAGVGELLAGTIASEDVHLPDFWDPARFG